MDLSCMRIPNSSILLIHARGVAAEDGRIPVSHTSVRLSELVRDVVGASDPEAEMVRAVELVLMACTGALHQHERGEVTLVEGAT